MAADSAERSDVVKLISDIEELARQLQLDLKQHLMLASATAGLGLAVITVGKNLLFDLHLDARQLADALSASGDRTQALMSNDLYEAIEMFVHSPDTGRHADPAAAQERLRSIESVAESIAREQSTPVSARVAALILSTLDAARSCAALVSRTSLDEVLDAATTAAKRLSFATLHPWVADTEQVWRQPGHHTDALRSACVRVETELRDKLCVGSDVDGKDLASQAFSLKPATAEQPRLRFEGAIGGSREWINLHEGAANLGRACFQRIRNQVSHKSTAIDPAEAIDAMHALSLLSRWIDDSTLKSLDESDV